MKKQTLNLETIFDNGQFRTVFQSIAANDIAEVGKDHCYMCLAPLGPSGLDLSSMDNQGNRKRLCHDCFTSNPKPQNSKPKPNWSSLSRSVTWDEKGLVVVHLKLHEDLTNDMVVIMDCHGMLNGETVGVIIPSSVFPKSKGGWKKQLVALGIKNKVFVKGLDLLNPNVWVWE